MTTFKITSDRITDHKKGSTVDAEALEGANIEALIEGGHIAPVVKTNKQDSEEPKEK
jgi:hypothetical protein